MPHSEPGEAPRQESRSRRGLHFEQRVQLRLIAANLFIEGVGCLDFDQEPSDRHSNNPSVRLRPGLAPGGYWDSGDECSRVACVWIPYRLDPGFYVGLVNGLPFDGPGFQGFRLSSSRRKRDIAIALIPDIAPVRTGSHEEPIEVGIRGLVGKIVNVHFDHPVARECFGFGRRHRSRGCRRCDSASIGHSLCLKVQSSVSRRGWISATPRWKGGDEGGRCCHPDVVRSLVEQGVPESLKRFLRRHRSGILGEARRCQCE